MKKKEWFSLEKLKKIPKNQLLIGGLFGVLLLVIAIPTGGGNKQENKTQDIETEEEETTTTAVSYQKKLERELKQVLEKMEGVGKAEVMITLQDEGERVLEKDMSKSSKEVSEEDGEVKRKTQEHQVQEETVFSQGSGSGGEPFVAREAVPKVEGVLIVAEGGGDSKVAKNISDAVLALFPVEIHKIKVVKMN